MKFNIVRITKTGKLIEKREKEIKNEKTIEILVLIFYEIYVGL